MPMKNYSGFSEHIFWYGKHFNNLKNLFSTIKNLLCIGNIPWMLKVIHGAINTNKESLLSTVHIHIYVYTTC